MFGKVPKLILWYVITDGEWAGVTLPAYYNVKRLIGKHGTNKGFAVGKKSKFAREFFTVIESKSTSISDKRLDRLPVTELSEVKGVVRTVSEIEKKPLPEAVKYSVIGNIIPP